MILLQVFGQNVTTYPGDGTFGSHTGEVILMLLGAFILGWLLHHFIYCTRHKARIAELEGDLRSSRAKLKTAEADLAKCNSQAVQLKGDNVGLSARIKALEGDLANAQSMPAPIPAVDESAAIVAAGITSDAESRSTYDASGARAIFGKKVNEDDLKIVEGIGPKTEQILNQSSITTWRQLANTSEPQLQGILNDAGDRFQLLKPGTWPKQAEMAADGDWQKLKEYQDFLVGGVEPDGDVIASGTPGFSSDSPASNLVADGSTDYDGDGAKAVFGKRIKQDDLKIVEGIGPKIEELLRGGGVATWRQLSTTSVDRLQEILNSAGERYRMHNPTTWPKQAGLAADGKWDMLQEYQDFLDGGVEPS